MIFNQLNKPYPVVESITNRILLCIYFGVFVFLFLLFFQPFGIANTPYNLFYITLGYGATCFIVMFFLNVVSYISFQNFFSENNWTVKKEILWTLLNIFLIGAANFLFTFFMSMTSFSLQSFWWYTLYTIGIGAFPVTIGVLINFNRLQNKFKTETEAIKQHIDYKKLNTNNYTQTLKFYSENGTCELEISSNKFMYAKSQDNYVEIVYIENSIKARKLIRNTLKNILSIFSEDKDIFQCHRSYIVNMSKVNNLMGNAQGYKLYLKDMDEWIPVSRAKNDFIKNYFTTRP